MEWKSEWTSSSVELGIMPPSVVLLSSFDLVIADIELLISALSWFTRGMILRAESGGKTKCPRSIGDDVGSSYMTAGELLLSLYSSLPPASVGLGPSSSGTDDWENC